jgi:hypothetical protein
MFAGFAMAAMLAGIGILLVLISVLLTLAIDVIKPNAIEEWLELGYFGKKTFSQVGAEMKDLRTRLSSAGA